MNPQVIFCALMKLAAIELEELERSIVSYQTRLEIDPEALQLMEERLNLLHSLQRKYQRDEAGLIELAEELKARLELLDRREEMLAELDAKLALEMEQMTAHGDKLTRLRMGVARKLAEIIREHLKDLGFNQAAFEIQIERLTEARSAGFETVEFLFAPNAGEPLKPLKVIASSGEISRVMLAVKTALAEQDLVGLLSVRRDRCQCGGRDCALDWNENALPRRRSAGARYYPYAAGRGGGEPSLLCQQSGNERSHPDFADRGGGRRSSRRAGANVGGQDKIGTGTCEGVIARSLGERSAERRVGVSA